MNTPMVLLGFFLILTFLSPLSILRMPDAISTPDPDLPQHGVPASSRESRPAAMKQGGLLRERGAQRGTFGDLFIYHKSFCDICI